MNSLANPVHNIKNVLLSIDALGMDKGNHLIRVFTKTQHLQLQL